MVMNDVRLGRVVSISANDSDNDLFVTQNSFTNTFEVDVNSDFETLLNLDSNELPNFGKCELIDLEGFSSGSDTDLYKASQAIESNLLDMLPCNTRSPLTSSEIPQSRGASEQSIDSSSARFAKQTSDIDIKKLCDSAYSSNTENKSMWAVRLFQGWVKERRKRGRTEDMVLNPDIVSLAQEERELNKTLMYFMIEVRNQKGEEYRGNTLCEIVSSLQYYIRRNGSQLIFFESPMFQGLRSVLDARMKYLARQGIGIVKRQAEVISVDQEDMLWEKGMLGEGTPQQLLDTMVYLIGLNCALRAGDEHRYLRTGPNSQFEITVGADGLKGLKYMEDVSKTNRGGLKHRQCERKCVKVGQNLERPERCLVRLYEKYMSLRPKDGKCNAFYLRPLKFVRENTWYPDIPDWITSFKRHYRKTV
ncbi:uncharacterized protein KIAA1958-like [Haliotis rufescens]|uniref:uncharacterized protein KIAA1958-like n=1 Tax=Haliotis rufescens TaxID=6454 RepID=UPI00201F4472|nr:uncharacterized protein KIAA1958-like [Haliotis rufescens]